MGKCRITPHAGRGKAGVVLITTERAACGHLGWVPCDCLIEANVLPINGEYGGCFEFVGMSVTGLFLDGFSIAAVTWTILDVGEFDAYLLWHGIRDVL